MFLKLNFLDYGKILIVVLINFYKLLFLLNFFLNEKGYFNIILFNILEFEFIL